MRHPIHHLLICAFIAKPYPFLYLTIVFPNVATFIKFIKDFRIELYQWLCQRCQQTVNNLLLRTSDDFRTHHQETLLIYAQNSLLSSTEFAPELFIKDFDFNKYSDKSFDDIFRILTGYVDHKIKYLLFPILRKLTGDSSIGHSNLGIAAIASYKKSDKKVKSSLKRAGYNEEKIEKYMFFFNRFKEVTHSELFITVATSYQ